MGKLQSNEILDAMWDDFDTRVTKICKYFDVLKQELAEQIGLPKGRLSQLKGNANHSVAYRILLVYPEINARWLLFGQGNMIEGDKIYSRGGNLITYERQRPVENAGRTPEYDALLDRYTALVLEVGALRKEGGGAEDRGLASVS